MRVHTPLPPGWCLLFSYVLSQLFCFTLWHRNYKKCAMLHSIILIIDWWGVQCVWWVQSLIYYDCHRCIVCNTMSWLTIKKRNRPRFSSANTSYALQKGVATSNIPPIEYSFDFLSFSLKHSPLYCRVLGHSISKYIGLFGSSIHISHFDCMSAEYVSVNQVLTHPMYFQLPWLLPFSH